MIVYRGNRYGGNGWREGVIGGGIFWSEVVKYSRKYIYGELDGGNGWSKPKRCRR